MIARLLRLRLLLFAVLTVASVVPVLLLGTRIEGPALQKRIDAVAEKHRIVAQNLTEALDRYARDSAEALKATGKLLLSGNDASAMRELLDHLYFRMVCISGPDGIVTLSLALGAARCPGQLSTEYLQAFEQIDGEDTGIRFMPVMQDSDGQPSVPLIAQLGDGNLAFAPLKTNYLSDVQRAITFGEHGHAAIVDQTGRLLAHPIEDWRLEMRDISKLAPVQGMLEGETGVAFFHSGALQMDMVAGYAAVPTTGWGAMVPQPLVELEAKARKLLGLTLGFTVFSALGAGLLSWWLAGILARPVMSVAEAAECMARGGDCRSVTLRKWMPREYRTLVDSFNTMLAKITASNRALRTSEQRFKDFAETAADWFWETDAELCISYLSERYQSITKSQPQDSLGVSLFDVVEARLTDANTLDRLRKALDARGPFTNLQLHWPGTDGKDRVQFLSGVPIHDGAGTFRGYRGTGRDVTEEMRLSEQLSYRASHDPLTGMVNRHEFEQQVAQLLNEAREHGTDHALCFIDLDQFKVVNDTGGHVAGDELLRQFGQMLAERVRRVDTVARVGGDEFALLLKFCTLQEAERICDVLLKSIGDFRFMWENIVFDVGASIGLVPVNRDSDSTTRLLREADAACYVAKEAGRNRVHVRHFGDEEQARRYGEVRWVHAINKSMAQDKLDVYFQPIVSVDDPGGPVKFFELLLRMVTADGEVVPAGQFIPAAERYNLAPKLDRHVVRKALTLLTDSSRSVPAADIYMINLSGQSLVDAKLLNSIKEQLDSSGFDPKRVCFEITETSAITNLSAASHFMSTLRQEGCRFALDDFGSGLSSFAYLKWLPIDFVKIDGTFVRDIVEDPVDRAMVRSINDMGHVLGKKTIAEFVENPAALEILQELGVDYAQGYHIGKPRPLASALPHTAGEAARG